MKYSRSICPDDIGDNHHKRTNKSKVEYLAEYRGCGEGRKKRLVVKGEHREKLV